VAGLTPKLSGGLSFRQAATIDYRGALRFPRRERMRDIPDRLGDLLEARADGP
jgi:hypothetical protein